MSYYTINSDDEQVISLVLSVPLIRVRRKNITMKNGPFSLDASGYEHLADFYYDYYDDFYD